MNLFLRYSEPVPHAYSQADGTIVILYILYFIIFYSTFMSRTVSMYGV